MDKTAFCRFLVIDNQDLLEIHNLTRKVNQAIKHPEPVLTMDAPWDRDNERLSYAGVLYDAEEKVFKMWYMIWRSETEEAGVIVPGAVKLAYATSPDGIHWHRPELGLIEINGSRKNNYLIPEMAFYGFSIIKDNSDLAARRYKMIFGTMGRESEWAGFHIPLSLAYSADGIRWERPMHVNPVIRGISDGEFTLFYDADRRRYQLYTRRVPNLPRDISLYESYDLVNWEDKGRVVVPDEHDSPEMYNFYNMRPFRYEGLCLGLLNTQYTHPVSETYEAFHQSPGFPNDKLGHVDIQLAYSRNGQTWERPLDRSAIISNGTAGDPDFGGIYPARISPPVIGGETWIYYEAQKNLHCWWDIQERARQKKPPRGESCCMLARMPQDHWVSLDAGPEGGSFTTKPWVPPKAIYINADIEAGGSIEVELLTPYGQPMPGYGRGECMAVTAGGLRQAIRWKGDRTPYDFQDKYQGGVCATFHLRRAKLYSYTFYTLPDPEGLHELGGLNFRWLEHIKHRSDHWGRTSNEPAGGLPPYRAPGVAEE